MTIAVRILFLVGAFFALLWPGCSKNPVLKQQRFFSLSVHIEGEGTVTDSISFSHVKEDTTISLLARADTGSSFLCWKGDIRSNANPLAIVVTKNIELSCLFVKKPSGMQKIAASGKSFLMGSDGASSALVERPPHQVTFTYDYFIDRTEATQGEYERLMGANPSRDNASPDAANVGDGFPVTYARWYDAALFCNAKSKRDGFDTVYTFTAQCSPLQTCPYILENLAVHFDRKGYRLPTEAEWEYACRAGSAADFYWGGSDAPADSFAWCFQNSHNIIHPAGQKKPNGFGLFDMAGNVAEWVNDWRGVYPDSACVNPVGPVNLPLETFEASWERPIRGGCYSLGTSFLRSSSRQVPYEIPASARTGYIGFRTALGVFFPDTAAKRPNAAADSALVNLDCFKSNLLDFIGTSKVKIAFGRTGVGGKNQFCFIDFTRPTAVVAAIQDSLPVNKPAISPNGRFAAYGSKAPGFTGSSVTTIRLLDSTAQASLRSAPGSSMFLPRWSVDTASRDTFIIFTDGASMNNLVQWTSEKTYRQKFSAGSFSGPAQVVCAAGSFHGGMSRDGRFAATGYPRALVYAAATGDINRYFLPPYSGRDDTAQVCNVSITPSIDKPDEIMFLDFGYSPASGVVGRPYGFHSVIFIANAAGVQKWFPVPDGYDAWYGAQWSNHPDFAIALASSSDSESVGSVFVIDLKNSRYLKIAHGQGLRDPCLWIDPAAISETPDPYGDFAHYNIPSNSLGQYMLDSELKYYWARRETIECAIIGSSHVMFGVDPFLVGGHQAVQISIGGMELNIEQMLITDFLHNLSPRLKVVGMSCDPGWLSLDLTQPDPHDLGFVYSKGVAFDKEHGFWKDGVPDAIKTKITAFNAATWPRLVDSTGAMNYLPLGDGWGEPLYDGGDYVLSDSAPQRYLARFRALADSLAAWRIHFLLVKFPEHPGYRDLGVASRYGPSFATYNRLVAWFRELEQANPYFHFYDANMNGGHDYTSGEALDCDHLNYAGRQKISSRLDSVITTFFR